jgi:hypothetical protein
MREVNKMSDAGTTAAKRSGADGRDESGAGDSAEESAFRRGGMTADEVAKLYGEEDLTSEPDSASDETGGSSDRIEGVPVFRADPEVGGPSRTLHMTVVCRTTRLTNLWVCASRRRKRGPSRRRRAALHIIVVMKMLAATALGFRCHWRSKRT